MIDFTRARYKPYEHQIVGANALAKWDDPSTGRLIGGIFFLADEMGLGKTKQCVDAAQHLFLKGEIDQVLVIAPAPVRAVWYDWEFGQLQDHCWDGVPNRITQYHGRLTKWDRCVTDPKEGYLEWTITNYEFIRRAERLRDIAAWCDEGTLLILDEASAIKSWKAECTRACKIIRRRCKRIILLNGTPIVQNVGDLFSQAEILDPRILGYRNWFHFRANHAIMGGFRKGGVFKQIVGWRGVEEIQAKLAPYVLRRLKSQCLDLPPKLPPVTISVAMKPKTWKIYKEMREEMVAWLTDQNVGVAAQAAVKALRLSQITSGFLGGIQTIGIEEGDELLRSTGTPEIIGREKLDTFLKWLDLRLEEDPNLKLLVWTRFRAELSRLFDELPSGISKGRLWGSQSKDERQDSIRLLTLKAMPEGPVIVIGTPATGAMGLNLTGAYCVVYMSNDYNLKTRLQSEDRVHRPGQTHPVSYFDMVATGPQGQKTIDHRILRALRNKEDVANWTTSAWLDAMED